MSAYIGTYVFTREQLAALLTDVAEEAHSDYLDVRGQTSYGKSGAAWPGLRDAVVAATLNELAFDATRPGRVGKGA